jgi:hypothetical protein
VGTSTSITFRVTNPVSGATYTWSGAAGTASGTGDGTYTVSGATTGTKSVTAYASLTSNGTTCQSANSSLSAYVSQPSTNGQTRDATCGCAPGLSNCSNTCRTPATTYQDGECTGVCNQRTRIHYDECGDVSGSSTFTDGSCMAGCLALENSSCSGSTNHMRVRSGGDGFRYYSQGAFSTNDARSWMRDCWPPADCCREMVTAKGYSFYYYYTTITGSGGTYYTNYYCYACN